MQTTICTRAKTDLPKGTKTKGQVARIWGLARKAGLDDETLHALVQNVTGKDSIRMLNKDQADTVIVKLGGESLINSKGNSKRSQQRRNRNNNVAKLMSPAQYGKLMGLAETRWGKATAAESLGKLCEGQIGKRKPHTTQEAARMIQTLILMNQRGKANGQETDTQHNA